MNDLKQEPSGVGGWLLLLVAHLIIGPLAGGWYAYNNIVTSESQFPQLLTFDKWTTYKSVTWCLLTIVAVLRYYCVWDLLQGKTRSTIKRSIVILWVTAPIATLMLSLLIPITIFGDSWVVDKRTVNWVVGGAITATIWTVYLLKSVRVRNTYEGVQTQQSQQNDKDVHTSKIISVKDSQEPANCCDSIPKNELQPVKEPYSKMIEPSSNEQTDSSNSQERIISEVKDTSNLEQKISALENAEFPVAHPLNISDDKIYEQALEEIENNKPHKASWARAFSETEGDEVKTKALYIKLRVANIKEKLRQEEEEREAEARRIRGLREQELRQLRAIKKLKEEKKLLIDGLGKNWSALVRKYETILAADNLDDYLYDIANISSDDRKYFARWIMGKEERWFVKYLMGGPNTIGKYGIVLIVALEKGIDIQGAKKWGRPSRFNALDEQDNLEGKIT